MNKEWKHVCDKCKATIGWDEGHDKASGWLIQPIRVPNYGSDATHVTRCPLHITKYALNKAGLTMADWQSGWRPKAK